LLWLTCVLLLSLVFSLDQFDKMYSSTSYFVLLITTCKLEHWYIKIFRAWNKEVEKDRLKEIKYYYIHFDRGICLILILYNSKDYLCAPNPPQMVFVACP
jgi:hypothetical protein